MFKWNKEVSCYGGAVLYERFFSQPESSILSGRNEVRLQFLDSVAYSFSQFSKCQKTHFVIRFIEKSPLRKGMGPFTKHVL